MSDSKLCLLAHGWDEVQGIFKNLPISTPTFELTITKQSEVEFEIQFKKLNYITEENKLKKINLVGLHDLSW
jgi:hypothetical protein